MAASEKYIRQPIVSVLGHVDHGKTSLLDFIRGSTVVSRESGAITQHIGATEVPTDALFKICGPLLKGKKFNAPGLLFIDTPGHHAFTTLRTRGGSLADLAVLIVDIREGFKPQTYESLTILKQYKTPFIIAANKIDDLGGWKKQDIPGKKRIEQQRPQTQTLFQDRLYELIGQVYDKGFKSDLYYNIKDFKKNIAIVPISALTGEGIPELLMILVGLAQRFLEEKLSIESGPGIGSILEVKEDIGFGKTLDAIIYNGTLRKEDTLVIGTKTDPVVTSIKALLKPKPMDEIRDPRERFDQVHEVHAACGIKIAAPNIDDVIPGAPLRVANERVDDIIAEVKSQSEIHFELDPDGIIIKADTIGSLEALVKESRDKGIHIRKAEIGNVSKRDITEADAITQETDRALFAFNVRVLPEAKEELTHTDVTIFNKDVIYTIMEKYDEWIVQKKEEIDRQRRGEYIHPGMIKFLPEYVFRVSHPAVIGVRILAGRIRTGMRLMREDGRILASIKGIQSDNQPVEEAIQGQEVAISMEGVTVGRQIKGGDILYTEIPEGDAKKLKELNVLNTDEKDVLNKIIEIKRKQNKFWGM